MPLTNRAEYEADLVMATGATFFASNGTARPNLANALWRTFQPSPGIPTSSVALDKTASVALTNIPDVGAGRPTILGGQFSTGTRAGAAVIAIDLLNHNGGLDGTLTTAQTTNLPTAALTRYTTGDGVMIGLVVYSALGTTASTVTVSYTNQSGTSGRTSPATVIGGTSYRETGVMLLIPLQAGDTGARSVESVTLAGTTGTAGNFGVVLYKPLSFFALQDTSNSHMIDAIASGGFIGSLARYESNACLSAIGFAPTTQTISGSILLGET